MLHNEPWYRHYLWLIVVVVLFALGGWLYFPYQTLGLTFVLSAAMLLLAMENSNMIEVVKQYPVRESKWSPFLVHLASQTHIALFIFYYQVFVYSYLGIFTAIIVWKGLSNTRGDTIVNVCLIGLFLLAAGTILVRRIQVGSKYEADV